MKKTKFDVILSIGVLLSAFALFGLFLLDGAPTRMIILTAILAVGSLLVALLTRYADKLQKYKWLAHGAACLVLCLTIGVGLTFNASSAFTTDYSGWSVSQLQVSATASGGDSSSSVVKASGAVITVTATGYDTSSCGSTTKNIDTITVTVTNNTQAAVSYDLALNGASGSPAGTNLTLDAGASLTFTVASGEGAGATKSGTITFSNVKSISTGAQETTTFVNNTRGEQGTAYSATFGGTYTVDGTVISAATSLENASDHEYALVATPASGYVFAGWMSKCNGKLDSNTNYTYTATEGNNDVIWPLFIKVGSATYYVKEAAVAVQYGFFDDAIIAAGNSGTIVLAQSGSLYGLSGDTFTLTGQTFLVPYSAGNSTVDSATATTEGNWNSTLEYANKTFISGHTHGNSAVENIMLPNKDVTYTLTIPQNTTLNVGSGAKFVIGGTLASGHAATAGIVGGTAGAHSNVQLEGTVNIKNNAKLSCCGYILGNGKVNVESGGVVYQPFIFMDHRDGHYVAISNDDKSFPFNRFSMLNIQSDIHMVKGATMKGYAVIYTQTTSAAVITVKERFNVVVVSVIGSDTNSLIALDKSGSALDISYDSARYANDTAHNSQGLYNRVGTTTLSFTGGASFGHFTMKINVATQDHTLDSGSDYFSIPYNYLINLNNGEYSLNYKMKILPGAVMTVASDANLTIAENGALAVMDGFRDHGARAGSADNNTWSVYHYPSTDVIKAAPLNSNGAGNLIVNGTLTVNGTFGGIAQTDGTGTVKMNGTPLLELIIGSPSANKILGLLDTAVCGRTVRTLKAQLVSPTGTLIDLVKGATYHATSGASKYTIGKYSYTLYNSSTNTSQTTTLEQTLNATVKGTWCAHSWTDATCTAPKTCSLCGTTEGTALGHNHVAVVTPPTCTEGGYTTHTCSRCSDSYVDTQVVAKGHTDNGSGSCMDCGIDLCAHEYEQSSCKWAEDYASCTGYFDCRKCGGTITEVTTDITPDEQSKHSCTQDGVIVYTATFSSKGIVENARTAEKTVTTPASHTLGAWEQEVPAGCETDGTKGHYTCSACGKYFDTDKTTEITDLKIVATGHNMTDKAWNTTETTHTQKCFTCGEEQGSAQNHTWDNGTCSVCQYGCAHEYTEMTDTQATPADCEHDATYYARCSKCNDVSNTETITAEDSATGHTYADLTVVFSEDGATYTVSVTCSKCTDTMPNHTKSETRDSGEPTRTVTATCLQKGEVHYVAKGTFENFSYNQPTTVISDFADHKYGEWIPEVSATCEERGTLGHYECSVCGWVFDENHARLLDLKIEPDGHSWGETAYTWNEDHTSCTAKRVCGNDKTHVETETTTTVSSEVKVAATCTVGGSTEYTATFAESVTWAETQTVSVDVAALGHSPVSHAAKAPACNAIGWDAYETCSRCDYTTYVEKPATGQHGWIDATCTAPKTCEVCGETEGEARGHELEHVPANAPTCIAQGNHECYVCGDCQAVFVDKDGKTPVEDWTTLIIPATGKHEDTDNDHLCNNGCNEPRSTCKDNATRTEAQAATCTEKGNIEYWTCSICQKHYKDANCTEEITEPNGWVTQPDPNNHSWGKWAVTTGATCTTEGSQYRECENCKEQDTQAIPMADHIFAEVDKIPAGCYTDGVKAHWTCSVCENHFEEESAASLIEDFDEWKLNKGKIPAAHTPGDDGHCTVEGCGAVTCKHEGTLVEKDYKAPTCTEEGNSAHWYCSACEERYLTNDEEGLKVPLAEKDWKLDMIQHSDSAEDGDHECDECGAENVTVCGDEAEGVKDHVCNTDSACAVYSTGNNACADGNDNDHKCDYGCGKDDLTPHVYTLTTTNGYVWGTDGKSCTANGVCVCGHTTTATATITSAVKTAATCTTMGTTTYTATFDKDWATTQTLDVEDIATNSSAHSWGSEVTYSGDGKNSYTATRKCLHNSNHTETATAQITNAITTQPSCTAAGEKTYTATFTEIWANDKTTTEPVAQTNHQYSETWSTDADNHWHKCTLCDAKDAVAAHSDTTTKDHKCDTCGRENITAHVDENHDHACDNGCSTKIGACTDAANDGDHVCDYGKGYENGCKAELSKCADSNKDGDHKCDECDADNITVCGDEAEGVKDHVCNTDEACTVYSTGDKEHKDGDDNNHTCDYCNSEELLSDCVDIDPVDNKCDVCGKEDFCAHEYTDTVTPPSCGKEGYTTHTCSKCTYSYKDTYTPALEHSYTNYTYNNDATCTANGTKTASCDHGCGEKNTIPAENTMLEHKDEDPKDHKCDECGKETGTSCVDENKDHVCDFTGCLNTAIGECVDNDHDHKCDYGEDSETGCKLWHGGAHSDSATDKDHVCDYCGGEIENGESCSDKTDDGDHNCDVCGKADVTEHTYADATCTTPKTCTECGATEGEAILSAHKYIENVWLSNQEGHRHKCENCDHTTPVVAHSDNSPADHECDVCEFVMSECADANGDNNCDTCGEKLAFTITFVDYFSGKSTATFGKDAAITFPTLDTESYSFNLEFMGWADATGAIVESATATEDATYTAKYKATGFKEGSLQMSVEYGAEGDIVLYVTLFVYADTRGQFGAPAVLHDSEKVDSTIEFEFENQTIYMYKLGFTAEDIAAQGSYIYIQIGSGDGMYEERINKVLFQYAAMLEHAGIVDGEANAENILKAQQTLIDSIIRYGGAVQDCFEEDHTDVTTHGMLTATSDILSGFDKLDAERFDREDSNSAITTKFDAATGVFDTMISLEYYYTVSLNVTDATNIVVSVIVADSRAELEGLSEEFKPETALTAKRYTSRIETIEDKEYYVSTTDGMTINEMEDKYAVIYVTYTVGDETVHHYGDIVEYGIERFAQRQVVDYSPKSVGGNGETVSADKTYNTEQYVNMLLRILEANKAAKDLEAEKAVTAD